MPYADPERRKEHARRKYQERKHLWKNPDGTWKRSNTDTRANSSRYYYKNQAVIAEKRRSRIELAREKRTKACPVCSQVAVLVYDHCHTTDAFRNYICSGCNLALGHARDNPEILRRLAIYVEQKGTIS